MTAEIPIEGPPVERAPADAAEPERKALTRDYLETILICVIFVIFSRAFVFQQSKIPSGSMEDTLLIGDYIMVNRFVYAPTASGVERALLPVREIRRGDIIVFRQPEHPELDYIKRVAGLPGERVELRAGYLFVDGQPVEEPWVEERYRRGGLYDNYPAQLVEPGQYFVLGDHRNSSSDSRDWGQVPRELIKGRALLIWYSFAEVGNTSPTLSQRMRSWGAKLRYFFTRTRWSRCFSLIR